MQCHLAASFKGDREAESAAEQIRTCVHCGFCNATCPTYKLLKDELDGPRGRIYQLKSVLEGRAPTVRIRKHLDRCLNCLACETTCPSGVRYGRLLDLGRKFVDAKIQRPWPERLLRLGLRILLPYPNRLSPWVKSALALKPLLPKALACRLPSKSFDAWPLARHRRRMVVLDGCVQAVLAPQTNLAAAQVLDRLGISLIRVKGSGCCGALSYHLGEREEGLAFAKRNLDAWWPYLEQGAEAIVTTASGCGLMVKEYAELLASDPRYAAKAAKASALTRDLSQVLVECADLERLQVKPRKIAFHSPCTLQHGLRLAGVTEELLRRLGFTLTYVPEAHLCCGSAGAYSILQPSLARKLRRAKIEALESGSPELIATANIGCLLYLKPVAERPIVHWAELLTGKA